MPFRSEAQRRYFYAKASEGGKEGERFKKYIAEMEAKTPKGKKLPERVKTASQVAFEHGFFLETEKIAKKDDKVDRTLQALPGIGAILGGAFGGVNPDAFSPEALFPKYIKKVGINSPQARAMSALLGAGTMATIGWLPSTLRDTYRASAGKKSK